MKLISWLSRISRPRIQSKSESTIRRAVAMFQLPALEVEPGLWSVTAPRQDTYQVSLFLWAEEQRVFCSAACGLSVERDLFLREVPLLLLEENHRFQQGSYRLVPEGEQRRVVLGRLVDLRHFPEAELHPLGEALIEQMQRMIKKLLAMGLIIELGQNKRHGNRSQDPD